MSNARQLLSTAQVAEQLGVSTRTISRLIERGELIPAGEIPGGERGRAFAYLFDARDVEIVKLRRAADAERTSA